jgi:plastocyanin
MTPTRTLLRSLAATGALALALGACGDDDDATPAAPTVEDGAGTDDAEGAGDIEVGADGAGVDIADFAFDPAQLEIAAGTTVTWTNADGAPHTATSTDGDFDSGSLSSGSTFEHTFDEAGEYAYACEIHPTMEGTVVVTE